MIGGLMSVGNLKELSSQIFTFTIGLLFYCGSQELCLFFGSFTKSMRLKECAKGCDLH